MKPTTLQNIIDLDDLRELMRFFHEGTGLSVRIKDKKGSVLVALGGQDICSEFHWRHSQRRKECLVNRSEVPGIPEDKKYLTYECANGLVEIVFPLELDNDIVGYFFLGQFFYEPPDEVFFRSQAASCGFDLDSYIEALNKVPIIPKVRIEELMRFFTCFFKLLMRLGSESRQRRLAEMEISKVREQFDSKVEERTGVLNAALLEIGDLAAQLSGTLNQVEHLAVTDTLTDTYNRRKFDEVVMDEHQKTCDGHTPFSLIMFDIDHFKRVNDKYGHKCGDQVLKALCRLIRGLIRQGDFLIRWGGEEFLILLPDTLLEEAALLAERIREDVAEESFPEVKNITISLGVAQLSGNDSIDSLLKRVDDCLYMAKQTGRNRVVVEEREEGTLLTK